MFKKDPKSVQDFLNVTVLERKDSEENERVKQERECAKQEQERARQHELELAKINAGIRSENLKNESLNDDLVSLENLLKSVKTLSIPVPTRPENWSLFFTSLERAFEIKIVPDNLKSEILINILGEKAANILPYINEEELKNYETIKNLVLKEFEPSVYTCYENFKKAKKQPNETYVQFASRLKTIWEHYLKRRNANDLEAVNKLIIADRIFSTLEVEASMHVMVRQGEKWFDPAELAQELDIYFLAKDKFCAKPLYTYQKYPRNDYTSQNALRHSQVTNSKHDEIIQKPLKKTDKKIECFVCGDNHMARDCENKYLGSKESKNKTETAVTAKIDFSYLREGPIIDLQPLETVDVFIGEKKVSCVIDSGTQIPILRSSILNDFDEGFGKIILSSAFGEKVEAKLRKILITLKNDLSSINYPLECVVAVTDKLMTDSDALLPPKTYQRLLEISKESDIENNEISLAFGDREKQNIPVHFVEPLGNGEKQLSIELIGDGVNDLSYSGGVKLKHQQNNCNSLSEIRKDLKRNKGNLILIEGLIYHKDITKFIQTCSSCQLKKNDKISDRSPTTLVFRPEHPFEVGNIDIMRPIEPSSSRIHKYALCLFDQHGRWPEAVSLKFLSTKATCDALLKFFSTSDILNVFACNKDTNFTSFLTREFLKRIGSRLQFLYPGSPSGKGLIERRNKGFKGMFHHEMREDSRSWDKHAPFLLSAYREVHNATTEQPLFKLLYDRQASGPLAILKFTWSGEIHLLTNISQPAVEHLQKIKIEMQLAAEKASLMAAHKQKLYGDYFDKKSSMENFSSGEQVVLLIPDSNIKLYARWTSTCESCQALSSSFIHSKITRWIF